MRFFSFLSLLLPAVAPAQPAVLDGVTFDGAPDTLYLPVRDVGRAFDWRVEYDKASETTKLMGRPIRKAATRSMADGTILVALSELRSHGAMVGWNTERRQASVKKKVRPSEVFFVRNGQKRVVVNRKTLEMRAWQGERTVLKSKVSLGRAGQETPPGIFKAQGYKNKLHRSSLYNGQEMPWSIHIVGNIFIHGFPKVKGRDESNGCIRVPVEGANPARWLYYWIEKGTPVSVLGKWPRGASTQARR